MASYVKAFVAENVAELRRMNARQFIQQIVALGASFERADTQLRQPLHANSAALRRSAMGGGAGGARRGAQRLRTCLP
jgi:hypothetical protein